MIVSKCCHGDIFVETGIECSYYICGTCKLPTDIHTLGEPDDADIQ